MADEITDLGEMFTYINLNGYPILRRCVNCVFWNNDTEFHSKHKVGYCTFKRDPKDALYFAFTLSPTLFPITKEFSLCLKHQLYDESRLNDVCKKVKLKDVIVVREKGEIYPKKM